MKEKLNVKLFGSGEIEKKILDPCCGGRMWWKNKNHPSAIYMDIRSKEKGFIDSRNCQNYEVKPDLIGDFQKIPFEDESFSMVVFDPPQKIKKTTGFITKKYGYLGDNWEEKMKLAFDECMRVLKKNGTLIIKWSDVDIPPRKILNLFSKVL